MVLLRDRLAAILAGTVVLCTVVGTGPAARAVVIDDFSVGPIVVVGPAQTQQTGLDSAHVLSGSRSFNVGQSGEGSVLTIDPATGLNLYSSGRGYFELTYDFAELGAPDLTQGGNDRFRVQLGEVADSSFVPFKLYAELPATPYGNGLSVYIGSDWSNVILEFPFNSFPVPVTSVRLIELDVNRKPAGGSLTFASISTAGPPLAGDYNRDGTVDAADYDVWRQTFGIVTGSSANVKLIASADGNSDGTVDAADYTIWRDNMTAGAASGQSIVSVVPEPSILVLLLCAGLVLPRIRRKEATWPSAPG